ncbi:hypothetical protein L218DRAFT_227254 [Marasmius fiardii PR-910]|nr:hypothetical protein L218DRAFT_227254 [Marasmius fiardii PR-910]
MITSINSTFLAGALLSMRRRSSSTLVFPRTLNTLLLSLYPPGSTRRTCPSCIMNHSKLATTGPYNYIRRPSYLSSWYSLSGDVIRLLVKGSWIRESGPFDHAEVAIGSWMLAAGQGALPVAMRINDSIPGLF